MTARQVRVWSVTPGLLSEDPRWHEERQELLWIDILGCQMHRGTLGPDGSLERLETISIDRHIGAVAPVVSGGYVLAAGPGFLSSTTPARSASWPSPKAAVLTCG